MPPFFYTKVMGRKKVEWFFSRTSWYPHSWHGFWREHKEIMPTASGTRLIIINFGWRNYGFFYFKETTQHGKSRNQ